MTPAQVRAFRNTAAQVCQLRRYPLGKLLHERHLESVLCQAEENGWSAKQIVCQFLVQCCLEDGRFNNFHVGFLVVMTYLNEQFGVLEQQVFADLAQILQTAATEQAILRWLDTHYP